MTALATDLEARLTEDPELGREALRRWLHDGRIVVDQGPDGPTAQGELLPLMVLADGSEKARAKSGGGASGSGKDAENRKTLGDGSFSKDSGC